MDKRQIGKWVWRSAGLIIFGALGSALWELLLRPVFRQAGYWVLDIASFGLQSFRNDVYRQIATDSTAGPSTEAYSLLITFFVAACVILVFVFSNRFADARDRGEKLKVRGKVLRATIVEGRVEKEPAPTLSLEELESHILLIDGSLAKYRRRIYVFVCIVGINVVTAWVQFARSTYVNSAVIHYQQALRISSPYLSDSEHRETESRFAQIASRADYISVVGGLEDIAKKNGQRVPEFYPW
jgi:hypothetical protein